MNFHDKDLRVLTGLTHALHKFSDIEEIYRVALDSVMELESVDMTAIYLVDEEKREAVLQAYRNLTADYVRRAARIPYPKGVTWTVINSGTILNVEDIEKDLDIGPAGRDIVPHSCLGIPIFLGEKVIGVIWFARYKERKFNERQVTLLSTVGDQIAIAITKSKREESLRTSLIQLSKKSRYETMISTVTRCVHSSINLDEVLENAVDAMSKNIDGVDNIAIYLVEGKEAILKAYRGFTDSYVERARRIPYPKGFTWKTIIDGSPMYCADVEQDTIIGAAGREMGTKSYVSMPINCGGKAVGTININSLQKNAFDEEEIKLLEIVAQQIETAFNNARQAEALRQSEERYRDFVENSLDLICIHDLEGNILSVNRALIKQLGYERAEDFVGRKISDFLPPHRRHLFGPYIDTLAKEGEARGLMRVLTRSGEERILEYNNSLRTEGVDKPIIRGVSHDVTERQRAEEALQQSHAQLAKKNRYETIVSTVTQSVHKSIKLQDVLENAVEAMSKNIDEADHISIYLVEGEEAVLRAYRGSLEFLIERVRRIPYSRGFTWKTIIEGKSSYVADADQDTAIGPVGKEIGTKSYVSMPIYHEGKTVGVININSLQRNAFNEEDLKLLEIVTHQIETAFNNGRQAEALRKARDELEMRVRERTAELTEVNKVLQIEISERKEVEEELRESEGRFSSFMQNLPAAAWIKDIKECYIYANRIGEEIFHKKLSDLIGKTDDEIFPADTAKQFKENDKLVITRGESLQTIETLPQEDGIHHSIVSKFPIFDHNGALVMIGGVAIDITERMNAEEALRESEERYRTFVEHTYDLLIEVTVDGRFLYVSSNFKDVLGYEPIELLGRSIFEHIHPDDRPAATTEFMRAVATFSTGHAVYRFRHKDGQWLWFESTGKPFQAAPGEIRGFIASRDITERRRMEEELIKTQKLESIGVLAGGVAHDFNNLLTAILGNISLTKMYANPEDDIYKRLTEAEKACLRAKGLTQQLLTFSKGGAPIKKVAFIKGLIKDSATFALIGSNVRCEFHMAEDLWKVEVDEGQISQVINNLVINAVQAMPEGGAIRVRAENVNFGLGEGLPLKEGKYVKVTMEDEGIGIPEEHLSKIFDPYFTTKQKGSGLGLAAAYSIIRSHNGYIGVESDLGVGTKFYIHLPASEKEILAKGDIKERPIIGKGRILVMDDDEAVRGVIGAVLRRIGYEVEFARDGEEAIELYREAKGSSKPFNIVIMDLTVLGGMGGREAIKRLLEIDPRIKAIVSSGYSNDPVISEYKKYGFSGVVAKPFKIQELGDVLNRIIQETSQEAV